MDKYVNFHRNPVNDQKLDLFSAGWDGENNGISHVKLAVTYVLVDPRVDSVGKLNNKYHRSISNYNVVWDDEYSDISSWGISD